MVPPFFAIAVLVVLGIGDLVSSSMSDDKGPNKCEKDWHFFKDSCYLLQKLGIHGLIRTDEENDFIVKNVLPEPTRDKDKHRYGMWIGLRLKWATCDGCNYVESAIWADGTPLEASALLPKPITRLTDKYGKYPWLSGSSAQPDRFGKNQGCAHYFDTEGFSVGGWGLADCNDRLQYAICQKKAIP